ncbi:hypothetical protein ACHAPX_002102 [Trichoderma viride]
MAPSQEKYYSAEFGKLPVHFNITQPCPESELEAADDYANELKTEASVALDKFISLITFTPAYAKNMIDDLCLFMGPVADIQSYPEHVQQNIRRHDYWYTAIFNNILNAAASYTWETLKSSPFDLAYFRWLQSNNTDAARDAILMVLLHSHVRSFRNRAALGQRDWKDLFGRLESKSLADEIGQIPNLIGVYALHAPCKAESAHGEMAYVGQACSLSGFDPTRWGIQLRARGHLNEIDRHKRLQHSQVKERRSWMYTKLSHEDTEEVSHCRLHAGGIIAPTLSFDIDGGNRHDLYKTSTLAVLARRMQDVHRSVFGDSDGPETPEENDKKYWEDLLLEDYGNIWGFNQRETAKSRFEWVLTYIRTGELPADAKLGQCLLRKTLRDSFLKSKKHPYSFVGRDGGKELNPDLSSRWVQEFLEKQGAWDAIEAALGKHNTTLGILGLRDRDGVLIAPL